MDILAEHDNFDANPKSFKDILKIDESTEVDHFDEERPSIRWAPLGATASPEPCENIQIKDESVGEKEYVIQKLEEEQEKLTSSLTLLTSHFAQIQLRLKQITNDKSENVDEKLKELEEFANKGVPDIWSLKSLSNETQPQGKQEQIRIITDLKQKLEELESFAYQTGDINEPPTSKVLANQKFIMEQLRAQLDVNFSNFVSMNENELKDSVNSAINEIINPVKVREKLVDQLKTQILDLERFIVYLQEDYLSTERNTPLKTNKSDDEKASDAKHRSKKAHDSASHLIRRALNLLQLIAASQFGCHIKEKKAVVRSSYSTNEAKTDKMHWGDIRAGLEVSVEKVIELSNQSSNNKDSANSSCEDLAAFIETEYDSDQDDRGDCQEQKRRILCAVRKEFCAKLIKLMQHGLCERGQLSTLRSVSCFSGRRNSMATSSSDNAPVQHPWDIVTYFYEMKNGREIVNSPACKLSESFFLENVGGKSITNKEKLLKAIDIILDSHSVFKRSKDTQFKAFVCLALNEKCLAEWLKIILKNRIILHSFYESWSYAHMMGFDDTLHSLKRLSLIDFDLPYDLSVRQLTRIKDAF